LPNISTKKRKRQIFPECILIMAQELYINGFELISKVASSGQYYLVCFIDVKDEVIFSRLHRKIRT
jgi:hypothetical protein